MKYLISYFLHDTSVKKKRHLSLYFRAQIDCLIEYAAADVEDIYLVSNIEFTHRSVVAKNFEFPILPPERRFFNKYMALLQCMRKFQGVPILLHDHDCFIIRPLKMDWPSSMLVTNYLSGGIFSEQLCYFSPELQPLVERHCESLAHRQDCLWVRDAPHGVRHKGAYSSELAQQVGSFGAVEKFQGYEVMEKVGASLSSLDVIHRKAALESEGDFPFIEELVRKKFDAIHFHL